MFGAHDSCANDYSFNLDSSNLKITRDGIKGVDFLVNIPNYVIWDFWEERINQYGEAYIVGRCKNLWIRITKNEVYIFKGSLCKWHLGNNLEAFSLLSIRDAIESLSDIFHLPFKNASVTKLDIGINLIMNYKINLYLNYLGSLARTTRLEMPTGLYYQNGNFKFVFYDKSKEMKKRKETIPESYKDQNILRIELRYLQRLCQQFGINDIRAYMLYDKSFMNDRLADFKNLFNKIQKQNNMVLNFNGINGIKDLNQIALYELILNNGGEIAMINQINESYTTGKLSRRQADELKKSIRNAKKTNGEFMIENEITKELDYKLQMAIEVEIPIKLTPVRQIKLTP